MPEYTKLEVLLMLDDVLPNVEEGEIYMREAVVQRMAEKLEEGAQSKLSKITEDMNQ